MKHQQQRHSSWCNGEVRNMLPLWSHCTFEKSSKSIFWKARSYGSEGISFFPGNASSKYSQVIGDSQISWPLLVSRVGTSPEGCFSKYQSGLFFRLMLITSWLKEHKKPRQAQFCSSPPHAMVKRSHLNSSVLERFNPQSPVLPCFLWSCLQNYSFDTEMLPHLAGESMHWVVCRLYACLLLV